MEQDLINVLSIGTVRRFGDDLKLLETYIEKEFRADAAEALKELYYRIPKDALHNSSKAALSRIGLLKNYPEAEYWIGEVYRMEGEFVIALSQYRKALNHQTLLENPLSGTDILYKIADLQRIRREYPEMTKTLDEILKADKFWSRESFNRSNMLRSLETNGINRFLVLFRHNEPAMEKAHRVMGLYYYDNGRHDRAVDHLLFAYLIQNTVVINALLQNQYNYTFTDLSVLQNDIGKRQDILTYLDETEYFKTMYYLANSLYGIGRRSLAREIWIFLGDHGSREWRSRAWAQLNNPQLDQIPGR
jgi:tetratricopeptide (TPR) repeat protein